MALMQNIIPCLVPVLKRVKPIMRLTQGLHLENTYSWIQGKGVRQRCSVYSLFRISVFYNSIPLHREFHSTLLVLV